MRLLSINSAAQLLGHVLMSQQGVKCVCVCGEHQEIKQPLMGLWQCFLQRLWFCSFHHPPLAKGFFRGLVVLSLQCAGRAACIVWQRQAG